MRIYKVEFLVLGQVTIKRSVEFNIDKELDLGHIFRSDISIKNHSQGFIISTTVFTPSQDVAYKVALLFVGQMLDVLSIRINFALNTSLKEYNISPNITTVKAVIEKDDFKSCFNLARDLNLHEGAILRAFSWYRKGLYTEDPFDKFLAFWNSITSIASTYCDKNERTLLGSKNQIWDCFTTLWGDCPNWRFINGDGEWINHNNEIRNKIAHGGITVDIQSVENVVNQLEVVQKVAHLFLIQWSARINKPVHDFFANLLE